MGTGCGPGRAGRQAAALAWSYRRCGRNSAHSRA